MSVVLALTSLSLPVGYWYVHRLNDHVVAGNGVIDLGGHDYYYAILFTDHKLRL